MKIAIIAPPWVPVPPPAYGGAEAVLDTLARGLQDAGHETLLYSTGDSTCEVPVRSRSNTHSGPSRQVPHRSSATSSKPMSVFASGDRT
jgi:hypothetical protein